MQLLSYVMLLDLPWCLSWTNCDPPLIGIDYDLLISLGSPWSLLALLVCCVVLCCVVYYAIRGLSFRGDAVSIK